MRIILLLILYLLLAGVCYSQVQFEVDTNIHIPDGNGDTAKVIILVDGYQPGAAIVNGSDVKAVCLSMEHSLRLATW